MTDAKLVMHKIFWS